MNCQNLKNAVETMTSHNAPLRMDTNLHQLIPALCTLGLVAVRPSTTGVRFYITVLNEDKSAPEALFKIKVVHGLTSYSSLDLVSGDVIETIEETSAMNDHHGGTISCDVIAKLCKSAVVAIRPSKTGIRMFSKSKSEGLHLLKERFLVDGTHDQTTYDENGEEVDYLLVYAPYGADEAPLA